MSEQASVSNADGEFIFSLGKNTVLESHQRVAGAGFQEVPILNAKPRTEMSGGELERRELKGKCYNELNDEKLDALFSLKNSGKPVSLVIAGKPKGLWSIGQVRETSSETVPNGHTRVTEFSVQLQEFANA